MKTLGKGKTEKYEAAPFQSGSLVLPLNRPQSSTYRRSRLSPERRFASSSLSLFYFDFPSLTACSIPTFIRNISSLREFGCLNDGRVGGRMDDQVAILVRCFL